MRILVVDDSSVNLEAAKQTLVGHELTVCGTYDGALDLLEITYNKELTKQKLVSVGLPPESSGLNMPARGVSWSDADNARWNQWHDAKRKFTEESRNPFWDAVLVDLLMPAGRDSQGPTGERYVGEPMPVGFALALLAAKNGAKFVAIVTATNHHNHPASAMLDRLSDAYWHDEDAKADFVINGAKAGFFHHPPFYVEGVACPNCGGQRYTQQTCGSCDGTGHDSEWVSGTRKFLTDKPCKSCDGTKKSACYACNKTGNAQGKDWGKVLAALMKE